MVIHALYENGVFRPTEPVALPESCPVQLVVRTEGDVTSPAAAAAPLARIAAKAAEHPANPSLPSDLAAQHDHYLYGTAKRS
jgi:predicted DNA-binding antitoxin AbrB/MazE fold protein